MIYLVSGYLSASCEDIKKEDYQNLLEKSSLVLLNGQLSNQVVKDLMRFTTGLWLS